LLVVGIKLVQKGFRIKTCGAYILKKLKKSVKNEKRLFLLHNNKHEVPALLKSSR
jgi:hypothetical protein